MLTRHIDPRRKIIVLSVVAGLCAAIIIGSGQLLIARHNHEQKMDAVLAGMQRWLSDYFTEIANSARALQPLTTNDCADAASELTSRAAFSINVRAFLLVNEGAAFCSSATGPMNVPMKTLLPALDLNKTLDMAILPGTPMLPGRPVIAMWYRNPQGDSRGVFATLNVSLTPFLVYTVRQQALNGIALAVDHQAISTFSKEVIDLRSLDARPFRSVPLPGLPLTVHLYTEKWQAQEIQFALLCAGMAGIITALLTALLMYTRVRPGKEILSAIKNNQFYVVYQPVVDSAELRVRGVEVLMRWKHPTAGEIPPDAFIQYAEAQKMIVPLTLHLFQLIARDAPVLQTLLPRGAKLGVNISPGHLHTENFTRDIEAFRRALPEDHFTLVLEITERDMLQQREAARLFSWLHNEGYEIAIDDFGTGHSALIYLERFTLDYLKIDRGFVNAIGTETVTSPVLDAVLTLAKRLKMVTVAEGVETPEQARWLQENGVHFLQGYYFSRPMTLEQFVAWRPAPFSTRR